MLVLSRRIGESIVIGDDVSVQILSIVGTQVRFGIAAPREIPVHREEVYKRMRSGRGKGASTA